MSPQQILRFCALLLVIQWMLQGCESGSPAAVKENTNNLLQKAQIAYEEKQYASARFLAQKALKSESDNRKIKQLLAQINYTQHKPLAAIDILETIEIKTPASQFLLAQSYLAIGQPETAVKILNKIKKDQLPPVKVQLLEAKANLEIGEVTRADDLLKNLLDTVDKPEILSEVEFLQSRLHKLRSSLDDEEIALVRSVQLHPKNLNAIMALAGIETEKDNFDTAEDLYSQVLFQLSQNPHIDPLRTRAFNQLSLLLAATGRTKEAIVYSRLIAENDSAAEDIEASLQSARVATKNKSFDDAIRTLLSLYNGNEILRFSLLNTLKTQPIQRGQQGAEFAYDYRQQYTAAFQRYKTANFWHQHLDTILRNIDDLHVESPGDKQLLSLKAIALLCRGLGDRISEEAEHAANDSGFGPELIYSLAAHDNHQGKQDNALSRLQAAHKQYPNHPLIMQALLAQHQTMQQHKESEKLAKRLAQHPSNDARLLAALFYLRTDKEIAKQLVKSTTRGDINSDNVTAAQLVLAINDKKQNEVIQHASNLLESHPNDVFVLSSIIGAIKVIQSDKEAQAYLRRHKNKHEGVWSTYFIQAQDSYKSGQLKLAVKNIEHALRISNYDPAVTDLAQAIYHNRAEQNLNQQKFSEARNWALQGIQLAPNDDSLIYLFTSIELADNNLAQAKNIADAFEVENSYIKHLMKADISRADNQIETAMAHYLNAWQQNPNDELSRLIVKLNQDQPDGEAKVQAFLERWIDTVPDSYTAHTLKAINYQKQGDFLAALDSYDQSLSLQPDQPFVLNNMAWILNEQGKLQKAAAFARRAINLSPENPFVLDTYGWILYQLDDTETAKEVLEKAASLAPDNQEIRAHLDAVTRPDQG